MTEQKIQKKITDFLEKSGAYVVKVVNATKAGVPDILCCYKGMFIAIEVKKPETKNNVSALQQHNLDKVAETGGISMVAWSVEQVKELVHNLNKGIDYEY